MDKAKKIAIEEANVVSDSTVKTLQNQWYKGDETVTLSIGEFITYKTAVDQAVANLVKVEFPEVSAYVNATTGEYVDNPSPDQIESKTVIYVVSPERTFTDKNRKVSYDGKITNELLSARELSMVIHQRNIEAGLTTDISELEKNKK
jgi:hypothetical protein